MTDAPLKLFNSLTRSLEVFAPVHAGVPGDPARPPEARVYTCGPTVYNYPHIGNMRAYVFADVLGRTLSWKGYALTHVINITDVGHLTDDADAGEDKLEKMAAEKAQSIWDIAEHYKQAYWADVRALGIRQPAQWTVATDYVPQMIAFAEGIAEKHCYELDSGLYFDVSTVADYGRLARAVTEDGANGLGARIGSVEGKRNAADFAIWRTTPAGETRQMEWDSPWGRGAPGWHLECSVMSGEVLGFPFDIHTGGIDHREIHHPNEIAQNQAFCGCADTGARVWMHNNFLVDRRGKMSKSSGDFLRLQTLIDAGFHPLAYRLMCLQAHYRSEMEFTWEGLMAASVRLKRMVQTVERNRRIQNQAQPGPFSQMVNDSRRGQKFAVGKMIAEQIGWSESDNRKVDESRKATESALYEAILNDLDTPGALVVAEKQLKWSYFDEDIAIIDSIFGLNLLTLTRTDLRVRPATATLTEADIDAQIAARKEARAAKDFARSDVIRDELAAAGVEVMDGDPLGWDWKISV